MRKLWAGLVVGMALLLLGAVHRETITQVFQGGFMVPVDAAETIVAAATITIDRCGGIKRITAAGAVTTGTTNTFTDPTELAGCRVDVCNSGAQTITLDVNAKTLLVGGANVALAASSCVGFYSNGSVWQQITAQLTAT